MNVKLMYNYQCESQRATVLGKSREKKGGVENEIRKVLKIIKTSKEDLKKYLQRRYSSFTTALVKGSRGVQRKNGKMSRTCCMKSYRNVLVRMFDLGIKKGK